MRAREHALLDREVLRQVLDLDERLAARACAGRVAVIALDSELAATRVRPDLALALGRQVARVGMAAAGSRTSGGRSLSHGSKRYLQRGWNGAAGRRVEQRRRRALDRDELLEPPLDRRHRLEQAPRVRVLRAR